MIPEKTYNIIIKKFFPLKYYFQKKELLDTIPNKIGILADRTKENTWEKLFSQDDLDFFYSQLPDNKYCNK
jgi:bile-salt sulfotransferase